MPRDETVSTNLYVASHGGGTGGRGWERERKDLLELSAKLLKLSSFGTAGQLPARRRDTAVTNCNCSISGRSGSLKGTASGTGKAARTAGQLRARVGRQQGLPLPAVRARVVSRGSRRA